MSVGGSNHPLRGGKGSDWEGGEWGRGRVVKTHSDSFSSILGDWLTDSQFRCCKLSVCSLCGTVLQKSARTVSVGWCSVDDWWTNSLRISLVVIEYIAVQTDENPH